MNAYGEKTTTHATFRANIDVAFYPAGPRRNIEFEVTSGSPLETRTKPSLFYQMVYRRFLRPVLRVGGTTRFWAPATVRPHQTRDSQRPRSSISHVQQPQKQQRLTRCLSFFTLRADPPPAIHPPAFGLPLPHLAFQQQLLVHRAGSLVSFRVRTARSRE
jgi:hypothetical protein